MIFRALKNYLYGKISIRGRDIVFCAILFALFYIAKDFILKKYLEFSFVPYNVVLLADFSSSNAKSGGQKYDMQNALLKKENEELREMLNLPQELPYKIVFAKVLTNIYAGSDFWVLVKDASLVHKGMIVWARHTNSARLLDNLSTSSKKYDIGPRLIGFVQQVNGQYVKVRPITHLFSRFSAQTIDGDGVLVKGNMRSLDIILSNKQELKDGQIVVYDNWLKVGIVCGKHVECLDFAKIRWVYINV